MVTNHTSYALSEDQIKQTGYYYAIGPDGEAAIEKLYKNKHLAQLSSHRPAAL